MADTPKKIKERKLTDYKYPIPDPDPYTAVPFWEGAKEGKLMLPRCEDCNRAHWYPRIICPFCYSQVSLGLKHQAKGLSTHSQSSNVHSHPAGLKRARM